MPAIVLLRRLTRRANVNYRWIDSTAARCVTIVIARERARINIKIGPVMLFVAIGKRIIHECCVIYIKIGK